MSSLCHAILPAAGIGSRMGSETPKQYLLINGVTLLEHSLLALLSCDAITSVTVALHSEDAYAGEIQLLQDPRVTTTTGGAERADSVLAALDDLGARAAADDWVLVHDAARPCLAVADIQRLIAAVISSGQGGILAERVVDTVKRATPQGTVEATLDRSCLWRAQTPQMFRLAQLRDALQRALQQGLAITDEASAMEITGQPVQLVPGASSNLKVTVPQDLALAAWYLSQQSTTLEHE